MLLLKSISRIFKEYFCCKINYLLRCEEVKVRGYRKTLFIFFISIKNKFK